MNEDRKILDFIALIRDSHSEMSNIYSYGSCINFYLILRHLYPCADLYYSILHGHVGTMINGKLYDINGRIFDAKEFEPIRNIYSKRRTSRAIKQMLKCEYTIKPKALKVIV